MASLRRRECSPYWWACYTLPNGKRQQSSTKMRDDGRAATRRQAQQIADAMESQLAQAQSAAALIQAAAKMAEELFPEDIITDGQCLKDLAALIDDRSTVWTASTLKSFRSKLSGFISWSGEDTLLSAITPAKLIAYRNHDIKRVRACTANATLKVLRLIFNLAQENGWIAENPAAGIKPLKEAVVLRRPFRIDELRRVLGACNAEWHSMVTIGYYTGQRLGDIASLRWQNFDLEAEEMTLVTTKTGRRLHLPLAAGLLSHLLSLPSADSGDQPLHPAACHTYERCNGSTSTLSAQFRAILVRVGLSSQSAVPGRQRQRNALSFHSLRDTATTALKSAGVQSQVAQEIIGHSSAASSQIYTKFDAQTLRAAQNRLPKL